MLFLFTFDVLEVILSCKVQVGITLEGGVQLRPRLRLGRDENDLRKDINKEDGYFFSPAEKTIFWANKQTLKRQKNKNQKTLIFLVDISANV